MSARNHFNPLRPDFVLYCRRFCLFCRFLRVGFFFLAAQAVWIWCWIVFRAVGKL